MAARKEIELADDQMCFACGSKNERGLRLQFELDAGAKRLKTRWTPSKDLQGYQDIVHGGMIGLVLDEMMVNLLWTLKRPSVTASLKLQLKRPAKVSEPLNCEAWVKEETGRIYLMEAEARNSKGEVVASASAKCLRIGERE